MPYDFQLRPSFPTAELIAAARAEALATLNAGRAAAPAIALLCVGDTVAPRGFGSIEATVVAVVLSGVAGGEPKCRVKWYEPQIDDQPRYANFLREDVQWRRAVNGVESEAV